MCACVCACVRACTYVCFPADAAGLLSRRRPLFPASSLPKQEEEEQESGNSDLLRRSLVPYARVTRGIAASHVHQRLYVIHEEKQ